MDGMARIKRDLFDLDAEQVVLGTALQSPHVLSDIALPSAAFSDPVHQALWATLVDMSAANKPIEPPLVLSACPAKDGLTAVGGAAYLADLLYQSTLDTALPEYVAIVMDLAMRRKGVELCRAAEASLGDVGVSDTGTALSELESGLERLQDATAVGAGQFAGKAAATLLEGLRAQEAGEAEPMLSFGWKSLDEALGPIGKEDVIVLAGRTSMGKSAIAQQMACAVAEQGKGVGFFALEMSDDQMAARLLSAYARSHYGEVTYRDIYRAYGGLYRMRNEHVACLHEARQRIDQLPLALDTRGGLKPSQVMAAARKQKRNLERRGQTLDLLVIDHIGEMTPDERCTSEYERASSIARWLKQAAKALQVPVLACVQINREAEKTNDKKPTRAMLRDSGRIEEIADSIVLIHRPGYYTERSRPAITDPSYPDWKAKSDAQKHDLKIIVDKARMGKTGEIDMWFDPATTRLQEARS